MNYLDLKPNTTPPITRTKEESDVFDQMFTDSIEHRHTLESLEDFDPKNETRLARMIRERKEKIDEN